MNLICDIYVSILNFHSHYVYNVLNCTLPQTFQIFMWNFLKDISKMLPFQMMNINSVYKINSLEYATGIIYSLHMVFDVMYNAGLRKTTQNNFFTGVCRVSGPRTYTPHTSFRTKQFWWRNCFQTALTCFQHMRSPW